MIDPALPKDVTRWLNALEARVKSLENTQPQLEQALPFMANDNLNATGYWETTNTAYTTVAITDAPFSAQHLHYSIETDTSLLTGATMDVGFMLDIPKNSVTHTETLSTTIPNIYVGSIDLYDLLGEQHRGEELNISFQLRRVGGSGTAQAVYRSNLMLRASDSEFYGG